MSEAVDARMQALITARLREVAAEEQVKILFAVESGSRAWGFHSPDSDYDVRFVYVRPLAWHLRLDQTRDVIERPIDDDLDLSGWELGKALKLACNSNAVIGEWLQSPVVYIADPTAVEALSDFCRQVLDRRAVTWHYLQLMARQQSRLVGPGGGVRLKRYFYILRPALSLRWMRLHNAPMPPVDMARLSAACDLPQQQLAAMEALTLRKAAVREAAEEAISDPVLDQLIAEEKEAAEAWLARTSGQRRQADWQVANSLHLRLSGLVP